MIILSTLAVILFNLIFYINLNFISKKIGIFDYPDNQRKNHSNIIPPIGGVPIFFSIVLLTLLNIFSDNKTFFEDFYFVHNQIDFKSIFAFFFCTTCLFLLGLLDDKNGVSANLRLIIFGLIFYFATLLDDQLVLSSLKLETLQIEIELDKIKIFFTLCCFLVLINALNMFDGINNQFGLYLLILFSILAFKKIFLFISLPILVSLIFFLYFNFKNKIFIGNHGVYFLSFILSFLIIKNYNSTIYITVEEVYLLLYLPILELLRLFLIRLYKNKNPFRGDSNHIHHYFYKKTNSSLKTALITNLISFLPFIIFSFYKSFYILIVTTFFYFVLIFIIKK